MPPDMGRAVSHASSAASQATHMVALSRPNTADMMRTRSETVSRNGLRPRSRGSTASIQSSTTQQTQDQHMPDGYHQFLPTQAAPGHHVFTPGDDLLMRFGPQISHSGSGGGGAPHDPAMSESHHALMSRANSFQHQAMPNHDMNQHPLPTDLGPQGMSGVSVPQYQPMYDSGIENQLPDQMMDENDNSEAGGKRRKGCSSTVANDNELRKLLRQYDGYTLKQMAAEVVKHEGGGGKAEKVKQVFAMIWLRENCRKSSGSVRRDRVYCCYAEKCGTERVSVLNPASFGKLVRIIFPNVQTRRLGVRGESKYHYVDLSVIEEKQQKPPTLNPQIPANTSAPAPVPDNKVEPVGHVRSDSVSQAPLDTAVFPSPTTSFTPRFSVSGPSSNCACQSLSRPNIDSTVTLENVASQSGRMVHQMLHLPSTEGSLDDNDTLQLPEIHPFLPANTDIKIAAALAALYRSHCISVIDSFRYCKERNLMRYFSSFHGTLTVPVQKLLTHPNLAPWIKECDWLMYQKMIAFVAPLTTQVVPKLVLDAFSSISQRLTAHIADTFKALPVHVGLARLIPAHIFCNLLRHMLDVNQAANAAAAWLCHPDNRNQMWYDFQTLVDPREMISKADIPACAANATEQIFKHDVRALLTPISDPSDPSVAHPFFRQPDTETNDQTQKFRVPSAPFGEEYNFPDKWIAFILQIPAMFPNHRTQCVIEKVDALWDCILRRLTLGGAQSFSAWWMTKVFFHEMMVWQAEKGGFMKSTPTSLQTEGFGHEQTGGFHFLGKQSSISPVVKDGPTRVSSDTRERSQPDLPTDRVSQTQPPARSHPDGATSPKDRPNDKSVPSSLADAIPNLHPPNHDDSAIDLDDDSMLMSVGKYGDMMASDPADAEGDVVVI